MQQRRVFISMPEVLYNNPESFKRDAHEIRGHESRAVRRSKNKHQEREGLREALDGAV